MHTVLLCRQATDWGPSILAPSNFTAGTMRASSVPKTSTTEGVMAVKVDCLNLIEFLQERCKVQKAEWSTNKLGKCCRNQAWRKWMCQARMQKVALFSERHQVVQNNEGGSSHKACYQNDFLGDTWRVARCKTRWKVRRVSHDNLSNPSNCPARGWRLEYSQFLFCWRQLGCPTSSNLATLLHDTLTHWHTLDKKWSIIGSVGNWIPCM